MKNNTTFVLGAEDPEMREIEKILSDQRLHYVIATKNGIRVKNSNAYDADKVASKNIVVMIECICSSSSFAQTIYKIDHHFPGDLGYGAPPEKYWGASSIGQLINFLQRLGLNIQITKEQKLIAAADHCLRAAYDGKCPGIEPKELMEHRIKIKSKIIKEDEAVYKEHLNKTMSILNQLSQNSIILNGEQVLDLTEGFLVCPKCNSIRRIDSRDLIIEECSGHDWHHFYTLRKLKEASAISGISIMVFNSEENKINIFSSDGRAASYFLKEYAKEKNLKNLYGDPERGYAGGFL